MVFDPCSTSSLWLSEWRLREFSLGSGSHGSPIRPRPRRLQVRSYPHKLRKRMSSGCHGATARRGGPLPDIPAEKVAASSLPDAPSNSSALALGMPAMKARHTPSGAITRAKRTRVDPHRYQGTPRYWAVLWRPDASAGPNPGGGFYGPPNSTVGYINPR
jgi:hypothetical protein